MSPWRVIPKFDARAAAALADRHYSRRKVGAPQFMPPGQTLVLLDEDARGLRVVAPAPTKRDTRNERSRRVDLHNIP